MFDDPTFWTGIAFICFICIVGRPLYVALLRALDNRAGKIKSDLDQAVTLREEAQELLANYQRKKRDATNEANLILENAKKEAESSMKAALEELDRQLVLREKLALERISQTENAALQKLHYQTVDLAITATQDLLIKKTTEKKINQLADSAIAELAKKLS